MDLAPADLDRIRDYTGSTPDDNTLYRYGDDFTYWQEVALRVLRRRLADANNGAAATTFALDGVLSVGLGKTDLTNLSAQIDDLQAQLDALNGDPSGATHARIRRPDRYR